MAEILIRPDEAHGLQESGLQEQECGLQECGLQYYGLNIAILLKLLLRTPH
jgi:hypothetical protein